VSSSLPSGRYHHTPGSLVPRPGWGRIESSAMRACLLLLLLVVLFAGDFTEPVVLATSALAPTASAEDTDEDVAVVRRVRPPPRAPPGRGPRGRPGAATVTAAAPPASPRPSVLRPQSAQRRPMPRRPVAWSIAPAPSAEDH